MLKHGTGVFMDIMDKVHAKRISDKSNASLLGFFDGLISNEYVCDTQQDALQMYLIDFSKFYDDADISDLLNDLTCDVDTPLELVQEICNFKRTEVDLHKTHAADNYLLAYLKGISCNGTIDEKEAAGFVDHFKMLRSRINDPRLKEIYGIFSAALADGVITINESNGLMLWISRTIGDSFADTGLIEFIQSPALENLLVKKEHLLVRDSHFVITGSANVTRSVIKRMITEMGGLVNNSVTKKTDYLFVGHVGSEYWTTTSGGTKIQRAEKLRLEHGKPQYVSEGLLAAVYEESL